MRELVVKGLESVTAEDGGSAENERKKTLERLLKEMQASNTEPMVPLSREEIHGR